MSDFNKLSELDKLIYTKMTETCKKCIDGSFCKQDWEYMEPVITAGTNGTTILTYRRCHKTPGVARSYIDLKRYTNLIENGRREKVLKHLRKGVGAYVWGEPGHGKSYAFGAIANEFKKHGKSIYFDLANNITRNIWTFETKKKTMEDILSADIVFVDDFGGEKITPETVYDCWTPIIKQRLDNGKPIYFSSNYNMEQLAMKFADATDVTAVKPLFDRISALGVFEFSDRDYRRE